MILTEGITRLLYSGLKQLYRHCKSEYFDCRAHYKGIWQVPDVTNTHLCRKAYCVKNVTREYTTMSGALSAQMREKWKQCENAVHFVTLL